MTWLVCPSTTAELKMLLYKQELVLLQNFEAKDAALALKMNKAQTEKTEVVATISECQTRLNTKRMVSHIGNLQGIFMLSDQSTDAILLGTQSTQEMDALVSKDAAIQKEFFDLMPLASPFHQPLLKIFKRKIKRVRKVSYYIYPKFRN